MRQAIWTIQDERVLGKTYRHRTSKWRFKISFGIFEFHSGEDWNLNQCRSQVFILRCKWGCWELIQVWYLVELGHFYVTFWMYRKNLASWYGVEQGSSRVGMSEKHHQSSICAGTWNIVLLLSSLVTISNYFNLTTKCIYSLQSCFLRANPNISDCTIVSTQLSECCIVDFFFADYIMLSLRMFLPWEW